MFSNSLFSDYIRANGLNVWKDTSTRDIICLDFDFGSRSYEEELIHLKKQFAGFEEDKKKSKKLKKTKIITLNIQKMKSESCSMRMVSMLNI